MQQNPTPSGLPGARPTRGMGTVGVHSPALRRRELKEEGTRTCPFRCISCHDHAADGRCGEQRGRACPEGRTGQETLRSCKGKGNEKGRRWEALTLEEGQDRRHADDPEGLQARPAPHTTGPASAAMAIPPPPRACALRNAPPAHAQKCISGAISIATGTRSRPACRFLPLPSPGRWSSAFGRRAPSRRPAGCRPAGCRPAGYSPRGESRGESQRAPESARPRTPRRPAGAVRESPALPPSPSQSRCRRVKDCPSNCPIRSGAGAAV